LNHRTTAGKRQREATRDRRKKEKQERLQRNRALRAQGVEPVSQESEDFGVQNLPEVRLEDIVVSGVAPRGPKGSYGPRKLFVGGLSWDTGDQQLRAAFSAFGPLLEATVISDRGTGKSRGFGFVTFEDPLHAAQAAKEMNGAELDGRRLKVNPAESR
jgi:hypothetical protein